MSDETDAQANETAEHQPRARAAGEQARGGKVSPHLQELVSAYNEYLAQSGSAMHLAETQERLYRAAEAFGAAKGWTNWCMELVRMTERHVCKCQECGDIHMRMGRRPGLYINGKTVQALVDEESK